MFSVILNKNEEKEKLEGFPWIFNNEVNSFIGEIKDGDICKVLTFDHKFLAYGFFNLTSKIMVRILSLDENDVIDEAFFYKRLEDAINYRKSLDLNDSNCMRLVFSEADFIPGLIVDKYADYLCIQISSLGLSKKKEWIINSLVKLLNPKGIYERSDMASLEKEGMDAYVGPIYNEFNPKVLVIENGIKFYVDMENGQKTGYFLDQKYNRDNIKHYCKGKDVLDLFSNVGGFALNAAKNKASSVTALDISNLACENIKENAKLNGFDNINVICDDTFNFLRDTNNYNKYDLIVLDPPAFTKSKETVKKAYRGYKEINLQAIKMIKKNGILMTFSCSQHMTEDLFLQMIKEAVYDSGRRCMIIDRRIQSPDHPSLISTDVDLYLKSITLRII